MVSPNPVLISLKLLSPDLIFETSCSMLTGKGAYHWKNGDIFVGSWLHGRQEKKVMRVCAYIQLIGQVCGCSDVTKLSSSLCCSPQ
jgi:hypothetical protein